jgi:hypothetical protein
MVKKQKKKRMLLLFVWRSDLGLNAWQSFVFFYRSLFRAFLSASTFRHRGNKVGTKVYASCQIRDNLFLFLSVVVSRVSVCCNFSPFEETKVKQSWNQSLRLVLNSWQSFFYRSLFRAFLSAAIFRHLRKQKWHKRVNKNSMAQVLLLKTADSIFVLLNVDVSAGHV